MIAYIAGKVTGDPNCKEKFKKAQKTLEKEGYVVLNPTVLPEGMEQGDYMRICFAMIECADVMVFLKNWRQSEGACLEYQYAKKIEKRMTRFMDIE